MNITKDTVLSSITEDQFEKLQRHFNTIYEVKEIEDHEKNIIYLCWLLKNGYAFHDGRAGLSIDGVDFNEDDYEISFEYEESGGWNYELLDGFYMFDEMGKCLE